MIRKWGWALAVVALLVAGSALAQEPASAPQIANAVAAPATQDQVQKLSTVVGLVWWGFCFALIFFMQAGFLLLEAGSIRAKNAAHVAAKVLAHTGIAIVMFYLVGFAIKAAAWPLCYVAHQGGGGGLLADVLDPITRAAGWRRGGSSFLPMLFAATPDNYMWSFFGSLMFCVTSTAIPGTVFSERFSFKAYLVFAALYSGLVYPVFGWLVWGGTIGSPLLDPHSSVLMAFDRWLTPSVTSAFGQKLSAYGMIADASGRHFYAPFTDYAGSTGVHALGGVVGAVGAWWVGARLGRWRKDGRPNAIPSHNVLLTVFSALLLAFCWFGFNGGSVVANYFDHPRLGAGAGARGLYLADFILSDVWWVFVGTALAGAGGVVGSLWASYRRHGKADPLVLANGLLGGLVAVCGGVGFAHPLWSGLVGVVAGFQFPYTFAWVERRLKLDDAIGTIACHLASGLIGTLAAGVFGQLFWWGLLPGGAVHPGGDLAGGSTIPTLGVELAGLVALAAWAVPSAIATFWLIDKLVGCRVDEEAEQRGLDVAEHGLEAFPEHPASGI